MAPQKAIAVLFITPHRTGPWGDCAYPQGLCAAKSTISTASYACAYTLLHRCAREGLMEKAWKPQLQTLVRTCTRTRARSHSRTRTRAHSHSRSRARARTREPRARVGAGAPNVLDKKTFFSLSTLGYLSKENCFLSIKKVFPIKKH